MSSQIIPYSGDSRQPSVFNFGEFEIRVLPDENDNPWFIAANVCRALDLDNVTRAVERLDDDEKRLTSIQGIPNQVNIINESGLYSLILTSRKPEAKAFKKWITSEVLPAIRKTGSYQLQKLTPAESLLVAVQQLVDHERQLHQHDNRIERIEAYIDANENGADYMTIIGYCSWRKIKPPVTADEALVMGRRAAKISRDRGYRIDDVKDKRFGSVHAYHTDILDIVFQGRMQQ
jgi:prophage antirepressor-like protein